jgi:hypothetical protein
MALAIRGNLLLESLQPDVFASLQPEVVRLEPRTMLFTHDRVPEFIYFPHAASIAAMVRSTAEGVTIEAGVVGSEGIMNAQSIITEPAPPGNEGMVQLPGAFSRVKTSLARECFKNETSFREAVLRFTNALLVQITQNLICNRLHPIQQRLSKWLLAVHDRAANDRLAVTHEFLSHMLGVHRPGVSNALSELAQDDQIRPGRGVVTILDRAGLETRTCECHAVVFGALQTLQSGLTAPRP